MRLPKIFAASASLALAFNPVVAQAASCQPGQSGCVLPLPGPAPTVVVPQTGGYVAPMVVEEGGFNILPWIIGLAALAAAGYFLFLNDDDDTVSV
jgi:hypothetical protein